MMDKQSLVIGLLLEKMAYSKVGILAKGKVLWPFPKNLFFQQFILKGQ